MTDNEKKPFNYDILWLIVSGIVIILSIFALIVDRKLWLNIISGILLTLAIITFVRKGYNLYIKRNISPEEVMKRNFPIISKEPTISEGVGLEEILPEYRDVISARNRSLLSDVDRLLANTQQKQADLDILVNET